MNKTGIEWCDYTWNPITGCTPVSEGCHNCYAAGIAKRFWGNRKFSDIKFHPERLDEPGKIKKPSRIFVCSMGDLFHFDVKLEWQLKVFEEVRKNPQHTFQVLTKRPGQILMLQEIAGFKFSNNVWIGVTCENQWTADSRLSTLREISAYKKFVSCEPLLEKIELDKTGIDWVIAGAETGTKARSCKAEWINSLYDQCRYSNIPFFYKQGPASECVKACREFPEVK